MTDHQAKKLNLALHLNPVVSKADQAAMGALQQWYKKTKQSYGEGGGPELDGMIRSFHHDLYLAGLHLYLINPRLCHHVAEALDQTELTLDALIQQLSACGLWTEPGEQKGDGSFSATQLEQLEGLLAGASETPDSAEDAGASALSQQLSEQREQLTAMHAELQKLRALAEEQAQQLRRMKSAAPTPPAPEPARAGGAEEMDVTDMTAEIAQIQKIRKKGVF